METGFLGHIYPKIDQNACIDCGLCRKVCPVNHPIEKKSPITVFAGWHKDIEEYFSSSSGGAAAALSKEIIRKGGVVYGCASLPGIKVRHVRVSTDNELPLLKGSKYVQSNVDDSYKLVLSDLRKGLLVLFIGTPCQVAGLKGFLRKDYDNLYTVDLICHGTPSLDYLKIHVKKVSKGKGVKVQFRKGNDMGLRVFDEEGNQIYYSNVWRNRYKDTYYNTFIDGYTYRDSCYQCSYASPERCSDITIGDYWGIGEDFVYDSINGCSCMFPITRKGITLLRSCNLILHERRVEEAVEGNEQLRHPKILDFRRKVFRKLCDMIGISAAYCFCEWDHIFEKYVILKVKRKLHSK